jgi:hypothetical protein
VNITTDIIRNADPLGGTALIAAASSLAPDALRGRPQDALMVIMAGRELGLAPMQSLRMIAIIKGKTTLTADATVALVRRQPDCVEWRLVESTAQRATYTTRRKGDTEPTTLTWTIEQAQRAGLANGQGWRLYPEAMLRARCASALARIVYPDLVAGIYDPDELAQPLDVPAPVVAPVVTVTASQPVGMSQDVTVDIVDERDERRAIIGELLGISDHAPGYIEQRLQTTQGLDLDSVPLDRLRKAVDYLRTEPGARALALHVAEVTGEFPE